MAVGVISYQKPQQRQDQPESFLDQLSKVAGIAQAGTGIYKALAPDEDKKLESEYKKQQIEKLKQENAAPPSKPILSTDPTSPESRKAQANLKTLLAATPDPALRKLPLDQFSANDINGEGSTLKAMISGTYGVQGRSLMATMAGSRLDETKNQNSIAAGQDFEKDPIIKQSKQSANSINRSQSILDNPNKPVTTKDLNLAYNDYINAVATGGAATEGKIGREMPETWAQKWNDIKAKGGEFGDLRQSPTGLQLINQLKENIATVNRDIRNQVAEQATNLHDSFQQSTNDQVREVAKEKLRKYAPEAYYEKYGGPKPQSLLQKEASSLSDGKDPNIQKYSEQHGLSYENAAQILIKRGYGSK